MSRVRASAREAARRRRREHRVPREAPEAAGSVPAPGVSSPRRSSPRQRPQELREPAHPASASGRSRSPGSGARARSGPPPASGTSLRPRGRSSPSPRSHFDDQLATGPNSFWHVPPGRTRTCRAPASSARDAPDRRRRDAGRRRNPLRRPCRTAPPAAAAAPRNLPDRRLVDEPSAKSTWRSRAAAPRPPRAGGNGVRSPTPPSPCGADSKRTSFRRLSDRAQPPAHVAERHEAAVRRRRFAPSMRSSRCGPRRGPGSTTGRRTSGGRRRVFGFASWEFASERLRVPSAIASTWEPSATRCPWDRGVADVVATASLSWSRRIARSRAAVSARASSHDTRSQPRAVRRTGARRRSGSSSTSRIAGPLGQMCPREKGSSGRRGCRRRGCPRPSR